MPGKRRLCSALAARPVSYTVSSGLTAPTARKVLSLWHPRPERSSPVAHMDIRSVRVRPRARTEVAPSAPEPESNQPRARRPAPARLPAPPAYLRVPGTARTTDEYPTRCRTGWAGLSHSREPNADLSRTSPVFSPAGTTERGASVSVITRSRPQTDATNPAAGTVALTPVPSKRRSDHLKGPSRHSPLAAPAWTATPTEPGERRRQAGSRVRDRQAPRGKSRAVRHGAASWICRIRPLNVPLVTDADAPPFGGCRC